MPGVMLCQPKVSKLGRDLLMLCLLVCSMVIGHSPAEGAQTGGVLTFGAENEFAGFDLIKAGNRLAINGSIAANTIMEPLFDINANGRLLPVLGLSATQTDDGKAWIIALRPSVTFHDGSVFDADAVVHHWQRLLDPKNKYRGRSAVGPVVRVSKIDQLTVRFDLKHPWLPFDKVISSRRALGNLIPSRKAVEAGVQDRAPVGTGPFKFERWQSGDAFSVVKNVDYWNQGLPLLDKVVFKPLPDSQTRYASVKSGQFDVIWMDRGNLIAKAKADDSLNVYTGDDNGAEIFILNTSIPPFDDVNVRRAVAHAHSQQKQVQLAYKNSIPVVHHPFGDAVQCQDDGYRAYNPDEARQMLAQHAKALEIEVLHSNSKRGRDIGEIAQRLLKDVGIKANPAGLNFGPVIKKVIGGKYQMSTWRISSRPDQGPSLFLMLHSKSRGNFSRYNNPVMDQLLVTQRMATDPVKREQILCKIARMINEDVPILYRGGMRSHVITRKKVQGIEGLKNGILTLDKVWLAP